MSWGAFNICSEDHAIHRNVDAAAGATVGVRYPHEFDSMGLRFWSTPMGAILDQGRLARSFYPTSWLYQKNKWPSPTITFYHGDPSAGGPAWQIDKLNGYDCSPDGDYFASFQNQCDRLWIGQNAKHSYNAGYVLDIGTGTWLRPAQVKSSNMLADPTYYKQRPFMPPTMPHGNDGMGGPDYWPNLQTKRGMREWVHDGWAYKKASPTLNDHGQHEFGWPDGGDGEWEYNPQWYGYDPNDADAANPTIGLDTNLLYLVEKRYSHGPNCNCDPAGRNPRLCRDKQLTGYRPHYWVKTAPDPQQFSSSELLKSWCEEDEYPFDNAWGSGDGGFKYGWPPYSISRGAAAFERFQRTLVHNKSHADEPYYAKTDLHDSHETSPATIARYDALCEYIPPNTAFDLIIYLQVVNYVICEKALTDTPMPRPPYPYHAKVDSGYFNTKCYCILHQIAPLQPKP